MFFGFLLIEENPESPHSIIGIHAKGTSHLTLPTSISCVFCTLKKQEQISMKRIFKNSGLGMQRFTADK